MNLLTHSLMDGSKCATQKHDFEKRIFSLLEDISGTFE